MIPTADKPDEPSDSPFDYSSIFWWGMFDKNSEGSRYMRRRALTGLGIALLAIPLETALLKVGGPDAARLAPGFTVMVGVLWIATGFTRYLRYLDEMQRQLQYESIAITYGVVMAVAIGMGSLEMAVGWTFKPIYLAFAEVFRAVVLAIAARRLA